MFELRVILLCLPSILFATTLEPDNKSILTDSDWKKLWMEAGGIDPSSKTDNTIDSSDSPIFDDTEMMAHNTTVQLGGTAFLVCKVAGVDRVGVNWTVVVSCINVLHGPPIVVVKMASDTAELCEN
ncbi:hypothetical protein Bhyg_05847 [Pseudolycoriella hygida]|uniref:Ig-like domain-containing protein n=1 Tax=Pseudolycoriella hygida TaxID=35572 RepID=A0A9Q0N1J9_9DIPT|nr:hypothetical protein Bhyg_05847 [Pseudolycoriella hygida]